MRQLHRRPSEDPSATPSRTSPETPMEFHDRGPLFALIEEDSPVTLTDLTCYGLVRRIEVFTAFTGFRRFTGFQGLVVIRYDVI